MRVTNSLLYSLYKKSGDKIMQPPWNKPAATLMLAAPTKYGENICYLTMKRSRGSSFMASGIVYPGGRLEENTDSSVEWMEIFKKFDGGRDLSKLNFLEKSANKPDIYNHYKELIGNKNILPIDISLRITAIRETFEECGILLAKGGNFDENKKNIKEWQSRVAKDSGEFIKLFQENSIVPDIYSLSEWSNWLTPPHEKKRFDTLFFMALINQVKEPCIDAHEAITAQWSTAEELLTDFYNGKTFLPTPQFHESFLLRNIKSSKDLSLLVTCRKKFGIETICPQVNLFEEGVVLFLPGDDMYPKDEDRDVTKNLDTIEPINETISDINSKTKNHHRIIYKGDQMNKAEILINIPHRFGLSYNVEKSKL